MEKHVDKTLGLEFTIPIGEELAPAVGQDLKCPEGYAVIMLGYGDQAGLCIRNQLQQVQERSGFLEVIEGLYL